MITMVGCSLLGLQHLASPQIGFLELRCALLGVWLALVHYIQTSCVRRSPGNYLIAVLFHWYSLVGSSCWYSSYIPAIMPVGPKCHLCSQLKQSRLPTYCYYYYCYYYYYYYQYYYYYSFYLFFNRVIFLNFSLKFSSFYFSVCCPYTECYVINICQRKNYLCRYDIYISV